MKQAHRQIKDAAIAQAMANPARSESGDCIVITGDARRRCDTIPLGHVAQATTGDRDDADLGL
ncbi:MAG: hypothetical protein SXV54_18280 [Chloroflexota bacterium]|nr:hypothetical protein [Chloroflexota bacterium]